jgi:DNA-binding LytR/AlgR family response regulator
MYTIAIVEDDDGDYKKLLTCLNSYFNDTNHKYEITRYTNAEVFLVNYKCKFDIVFMDIELTGENGMQACVELRKIDPVVTIIFVTNMKQFAVKGYEVNALDFIVKPVSIADFSLKLTRALRVVEARKGIEMDIIIHSDGRMVRLSSNSLIYTEISGHYLDYHTTDGVYTAYGKIKDAEDLLIQKDFLRCNREYLVNPSFIKLVSGMEITLSNGEILTIGKTRKKAFMQALTKWLGNGAN